MLHLQSLITRRPHVLASDWSEHYVQSVLVFTQSFGACSSFLKWEINLATDMKNFDFFVFFVFLEETSRHVPKQTAASKVSD